MAEASLPAATPQSPTPKTGPRAKPRDEGWREFITPEGVDLRLRIADASERAGALILDLLVIVAMLIGLTIAACSAAVAGGDSGREVIGIVWLLGFFALRNFYFTAFELSGRAATPGKRIMGLRVIARDGGRLTADSVFARNAMRELELFLPATLLLARGQGVDAWLVLLAVIWSGVFLLFPLFNGDRLRAGDIVAGTMVVKTPRRVLSPDLAEDGVLKLSGGVFTRDQLDAYGVKELHVLEEVLRRGDRRTMAAVARRIRAKIGWRDESLETDADFLAAYYAGLRGRLEARLLFGRRKTDKFDVG
jgi:uncharacterized RDD family membrane protein YckC